MAFNMNRFPKYGMFTEHTKATYVGREDNPNIDKSIFGISEPGLKEVEIHHTQREKWISPIESFAELPLHKKTLEMLDHMQFFSPNKVQRYLLRLILEENPDKCEIVINAEEKSGKTSTALLAAFNHLSLPGNKLSQVIVVCPTLELAEATYNMVQDFAKYNKDISFRSSIRKDKFKASIKIDEKIIVGTPEKIYQLIIQEIVDKKNIEMIIFDDIQFMLKNKGHESMLFRTVRSISTARLIFLSSDVSAEQTANCLENILASIRGFCPFIVKFPPTKHIKAKMQYFISCDDNLKAKQNLLKMFIPLRAFGQIVIVCSTRDNVIIVHDYLTKMFDNFRISYLYGKLKKEDVHAIIENFKSGEIKILITTPSFTNLKTPTLATIFIYDDFLIMQDPVFELDMEKYNKWMNIVADRRESILINIIDNRNALYLFAESPKDNNLQIVDKEKLANLLPIYKILQ